MQNIRLEGNVISLSTIIKETLQSQIYQILKKRLIEGYYPPGERLIEAKVAEEFGISRGPVRESLKMLIQEELLVQKGNMLHVFHPTLADMIDIYQCRQQLESLAAKLAALHIDQTQLEKLEEIIEATKTAWTQKDIAHVLEFNIQFHEIILTASGNRQLISLTNMIHDKVTYFRNSGMKESVRDGSFIEEHAQILAALKERNGDKAHTVMHAHIEHDLMALESLYIQEPAATSERR